MDANTQVTVTDQNKPAESGATADPVVGTEATPQVTAQEEPKETPEWAKKRFSELTEKRKKAENEAEYWRQEAIKHAPKPVESAAPVADPNKEPDPNDFTDYGEYVKATADHRINQKVREIDFQNQIITKKRNFEKSVTEFKKTATDFDSVVMVPELPITGVMVEAMMDSDKGPEIAYFFGKNPEEARRISTLSPLAAVREIGRLEMKLSASPTPRNVTQAPEPIIPIDGANANASGKDPKDMTMEEYAASREEALKFKGGSRKKK